MAIKQSSAQLSTQAARILAMDDDELRKEAIVTVDGGGFVDPRDIKEPRLTHEFCALVRSLAASVVSQDETKGQGDE